MNNLLLSLIVGTLAGVHASTWGMYKDSPHEGFTWPKYLRSTIAGALVGLALAVYDVGLDLTNASHIVVFFGIVYVIERAIMEFYKTWLRNEDQSKYFIPMQFHIFGKVVESKAARFWLGMAYGAAVLAVVWFLVWFGQVDHGLTPWITVLIIGSIGGWISAFGGAWKDAPLEGFQLLKFFRSPGMALAWSIIVAFFTDNYLFITMGGLGYTIATTETYKTFAFPSRPRGKFQGKPIDFPEMLTRRNKFVPLYALIWTGLIVCFILGFTGPHAGLLPG